MAAIRQPIPVKLICGVTFTPEIDLKLIVSALENVFSPVEIQSPVFDFSIFTSYYESEMGAGLNKVFLCFQGMYDPGCLSSSKVKTNDIEEHYSKNDKRNVNLDPGYITAAKLILATTKDFAHRIYIGQGIYGDVQYRFRQGKFEYSKWTYPDYQTELASSFFNQVRELFMQQEKGYDQIIQL